MLTQERAEKLSEILVADTERARELFELDPEEALIQINALGNDFTLDEINEFGQAVKGAVAQGELNADALDDVAGGVLPIIAGVALGKTLLAAGGLLLGGTALGIAGNAKTW